MRRMATAMTGDCIPSFGHSGDRRERSAPQVANRPPVLPKRNDERQDAARNQREPQIFRRGWKIGGAGAGDLLQVVEVLDDREAEADQRHGGALPRHHRAFDAEAGADPAEMTVCRCPYFEPARAWGGAWICHARCPFADDSRQRSHEIRCGERATSHRRAMRATGPRMITYGTNANSKATITASAG